MNLYYREVVPIAELNIWAVARQCRSCRLRCRMWALWLRDNGTWCVRVGSGTIEEPGLGRKWGRKTFNFMLLWGKQNGSSSIRNICNVSGSYSSRCKCLKASVCCDSSCRCKGCSNPYTLVNLECVPRKRKFELQASTHQKPSESLETKGKRLREEAMTEAECFVFKEIINLLKDTGQ